MRRREIASTVVAGVLALSVVARGAEPRDPTPDDVTVQASIGFLEPVDRFGDRADGGVLLHAAGYFHLTELVVPEVAAQFGFLDADPAGPDDGTIDTLRLLGGVRGFLLPRSSPVRPWANVLGGWAHYRSSPRRLDLTPVFGSGRHDRDDAVISVGGGIDGRVHPNFELGVQIRWDVSFTNDKDTGERDLQSLAFLGSFVFNF